VFVQMPRRQRRPPVLGAGHRHDQDAAGGSRDRPSTDVPRWWSRSWCRRPGIAPIGMPTTILRPTTAV
jgi:hypothetical protein